MIRLCRDTPGELCDGVSRREVLRAGGLTAAGLSLAGLLRAEAAAPRGSGRAKSCIILFLNGGPSHLDMWDMKPDAPSEIRGEFRPIDTPVPGIQLSEHLPRLAALAGDFALVRSMHHQVFNAHAAAVYTALTGDDRGDNSAATFSQKDFPAIGSVIGRIHPPRAAVVPYVSLPYRTKEGAGGPPQPGFYGGWMGQRYDPLFIEKDPNATDFALPELTLPADFRGGRITARRNLLNVVNRGMDRMLRDAGTSALGSFQARALDLITSTESRRAFDIAAEPAPVREKYGRNIYGQSTLLARRLIEAGCRVVTLSWAPDANATWDTHGNNFRTLKSTLLPQLDAALASLLGELKERGMLDETLVACMGEFGRTPKVNGSAGRDHFPYCYSLLLAGGGVRGGNVVGASDRTGSEPAELPFEPRDVVASIYHALGVSHETLFLDYLDRPLPIVNGPARVIRELF